MALILPPLKPGTKIVNPDGTVTRDFSVWWQRLTDAIRAHETTQDELLAAIVLALANAGIALAVAQAADAKADAADAKAEAADEKAISAAREAARISSYTEPTNVVSATDVGSSCTITVAAHKRVYPVQGDIDVPDLMLAGGTVTEQPYSTTLYVYCDDITLANASPAFLTTADQRSAQVGAAAGRHFVGVITTPAAGAPPATGGGGYPPGGGGGNPIP